MEPSGVGVNALLHILHSLLVVILHAGDRPSGPGQADDHPFAANSADAGGTKLLHVVAGVDVRIADLSKGIQHCELGLRRSQYIIVVNQQLLQVRQGIVSLPGIADVLFGILGDVANLADLVNDILGLLLILGSGRQLRIGLFSVGQLFEPVDQPFLCRGQVIVGFPGRFDGGATVLGDGADFLNQLVHSRRLIPVSGCDHGGAAGGGAGSATSSRSAGGAAAGSGTLGGCLSVVVAALFVGVVVGIVEDDGVSVLHIPGRYAFFRMGAVDCVHPAGVFAVVEFTQAVDGGDINSAVFVVVICCQGDVVLRSHPFQHVPHSFGGVRLHIGLRSPGGQSTPGQAVGCRGTAVFLVTQDGDVDGNLAGLGRHPHSDVGLRRTVGQYHGLFSGLVLVVTGNFYIIQGHGAGGAVVPAGRQDDSRQVQVLPEVVLRLVAAGDGQLDTGGLAAAPDFPGQVLSIHAQRIIIPVQPFLPGVPLNIR